MVEETFKKCISIFAQPYNIFATPYESEFNKSVADYCRNPFTGDMKCGKIVFIGDVGVGKTSIILRFCQSMFMTEYKPTIGVDFEVAKFEILGVPFSLHLWDTAGQEKFKCLASSYYRSAHVIVIVFDVTKMSSLANSVEWFKTAMKEYDQDCLPYIMLVGNKIDAINPIAYDKIEGYAEQIASHLECEYWPVSSKTGANITRLFFRIASFSFQSYISKEIVKDEEKTIGTISLHSKSSKRKRHKTCKSNKCNN